MLDFALSQAGLMNCSACVQQQMWWCDDSDLPINGACYLPARLSNLYDNPSAANDGVSCESGGISFSCCPSSSIYTTSQECSSGVGWCRQKLGIAGPPCVALLYSTGHVAVYLMWMLALVTDYYVPWQHKCHCLLNPEIPDGPDGPDVLMFNLRDNKITGEKISWQHLHFFVLAPIWVALIIVKALTNLFTCCCCPNSGGEHVPLQAVDARRRRSSPTTLAPTSLQHVASAAIVTPQPAAVPAAPTPLNQMITKPAAGVSANSGSGAVAVGTANHRIVGGLQPSAPPLAQSQSASQQLLRASVTGFAVLGRALAAAGASASKGAIIRDGFTDDDLPVLQRMKVEMLVAKYGMTAEQARLFRLVQLQDEALNAAAAAAAAVDAVNVPDHLTDQ